MGTVPVARLLALVGSIANLDKAISADESILVFVTALSAATNATWSNLIENDTYERLVALNQWIGGTQEEKDKAFFGRGPVTATFGGPFVSDMLRIGSLMNFNTMSGDDLNSYLEGYKEFHKRGGGHLLLLDI